ncbi:Glucosidase 2 subunit beta protein [Dioscorea alata]|uniref:Glucosidase 2 subunit beta protein n=1 Tax=Dioscorea alata TaxID=55571 RepID=A0ACB7V2B8_DIOAL|nr:Glucosidase 2 subunit beta protein [Dioscorea alata]
MEAHLRFFVAFSCFSLLLIFGFASVPSRDSLGIAPQDELYYKSDVIKCKDGSKKFSKDQLNDEFCDCPDGTDEPGTSACPEGKFYCRNVGHAPLSIYSSRVNDGICDCCDGSDEYKSNVKCRNTCWEAGKAARERLRKKIATYQDGVTIRKTEVEKAKQAFAKDEAELANLKAEEKILKGLVQKLKEHKEQIEKAEEEERQKKEEENKLQEEARKANEKEVYHEEPLHGNIEAPTDGLSESPKLDDQQHYRDTSLETESDQSVGTEISDNHEVEQHEEKTYNDKRGNVDGDNIGEASSTNVFEHIEDRHDPLTETKTTAETETKEGSPDQVQEVSPDTEKLSREELGRLVASRWTGENTAENNDVDNNVKEDLNHNQDDSDHDDVQDEYNKGYTSEIEDNKYPDGDEFNGSDDEYEDDHIDPTESYNPDDFDEKEDFSDLTISTTPSWLDKVQQTFRKVIQAFKFFQTPVDISEGSRIRKEYDESSSRLSKIQSRISSLTEKLKHDFGKEKEFYSFYGQCFENKENKYTYKVCPFKQATQVEGHSTTRLGNWDKFEESYRIMQFTYGDKCWNGPDRSLKVRLRCGLKNELTDVDEPSRCEYAALLSTPALCVEEKLKELQQKLELLNSSQPPNHDEL